MQSFSEYLTEARVSSANFEKVVDVFKRLLEKKLGHRFFRFGGPKGFVENKKGVGIMYIYNRNKAIRFNYDGSEITSITLWDSYKLGDKGDRTVDLGGLGLLQGAYRILEILVKGAKTGKYLAFAHAEINEATEALNAELLSEAKRIKPDEFGQLVVDFCTQAGINPKSIPFDIYQRVAVDHDVLIPSAHRKTKVGGKGKTSKFDATLLIAGEASNDTGSEKDYYIKITAQDKETKKFMSVKGDKKAKALLDGFRETLKNPPVEEEIKDPNTLFGHLASLTRVVARGARNSLVVYGGPGTGKSHTVHSVLKDEGLVRNQDWYLIKGKVTTSALYQTLYLHRHGNVIVFDDADSVWGDKEAGNLLKGALDSTDERILGWISPRTVNITTMDPLEREEFMERVDGKIKSNPEDPNIKLPSEFDFQGRVIFISNLPYEKFDKAVLTRSAKIDMTLTQNQMFMRMESILDKLGDSSVPADAKKEILNFLRGESAKGSLDEVSMRTYIAAEDLYKSGLDNWRELLAYV